MHTHTVLAYERWYAYIGTWCVKAPSFALSNQPTLYLERRSSRPHFSSLRCGVLLRGGSNRAPGEHCQNEMSWTWLDHARSEFAWKILAYVCVCRRVFCGQACVEVCCVDAAHFPVCIRLRWQLPWAHEVVRQLMMVRLSASMVFRTSRFGPMSQLHWIHLDYATIQIESGEVKTPIAKVCKGATKRPGLLIISQHDWNRYRLMFCHCQFMNGSFANVLRNNSCPACPLEPSRRARSSGTCYKPSDWHRMEEHALAVCQSTAFYSF